MVQTQVIKIGIIFLFFLLKKSRFLLNIQISKLRMSQKWIVIKVCGCSRFLTILGLSKKSLEEQQRTSESKGVTGQIRRNLVWAKGEKKLRFEEDVSVKDSYSSQFINLQYFKRKMFHFASPYFLPNSAYSFYPQPHYQLYFLPQEDTSYASPISPIQTSHISVSEVNTISPCTSNSLERVPSPPAQPSNQNDYCETGCKKQKQLLEQWSVCGKEHRQAKQKFGRNICSNIFHLLVKFIKKQKKLKSFVSKIIQQHNMSIKPAEFYQLFKNRAYKLRAYANLPKIAEFWRGPIQAEAQTTPRSIKENQCSRIFRILARHYLTYHHVPYVYNSQKIKSDSKKLHHQAIRKLLTL